MRAEAAIMTTTFRGEVLFDEPMSRHTSWRAGGRADRYMKPADLHDLQRMLQDVTDDEALLWMGLGSNTLIRDGGFRGTVIAMQGVTTQLELESETVVSVGAGVTSAKLAKFCSKNNLQGGEFFAGIPGLVGGALAMNAGAFGGETWNHVLSVETIDRSGEVRSRDVAEYETAYRSVKGVDGEWFLSARLQFQKNADNDGAIDIKQLLAKRAATQPTGSANCGSVFTNPQGDYAARLIEASGLKGERIGGAVVSEKHANFIINDNAATAADIESLIKHVQTVVEQKQGVLLHTEVKIYGDSVEEVTQK